MKKLLITTLMVLNLGMDRNRTTASAVAASALLIDVLFTIMWAD